MQRDEVKSNRLNLWRERFKKEQIVHNLELVQNLIVIALAIGLFLVMVIWLSDLFYSLLIPINFQSVTSDILFILILVEIFRLLIIYLQEQRISVGVAVEVSIVSVLREVIIHGSVGDSLAANLSCLHFFISFRRSAINSCLDNKDIYQN